MRISIHTNPDGTKQAVDEKGNPIPWISAVQIDLDASGRPVLWLAVFAFSSDFHLGFDTPVATATGPGSPEFG